MCRWNYGRSPRCSRVWVVACINVPNWIVDVSTLLHMLSFDTPNRRWIWSAVGSRWPSSTCWSHWWKWKYKVRRVKVYRRVRGTRPYWKFLARTCQSISRIFDMILARSMQESCKIYTRILQSFRTFHARIFPRSCKDLVWSCWFL